MIQQLPTRLILAFTVCSHLICAAAETDRQYYELRVYSTRSQEQQDRVVDHWQRAAVPAYNRIGLRPIGVFTERDPSPTNRIYVLIPAASPQALAQVPARLAADERYQKDAAEYLNLTRADQAYERIESSLLVAFEGMKSMVPPPAPAEPDMRVFELRTYVSPSEGKGDNKVRMFNDGEIQIMKDTGLGPVFFSQTLIGSPMPSLVYMTSGENIEQHKEHWRAFSGSPAWKKMSGDPQYRDNMTGMIRVMLKRTAASQI
jgi:hypothetical protein